MNEPIRPSALEIATLAARLLPGITITQEDSDAMAGTLSEEEILCQRSIDRARLLLRLAEGIERPEILVQRKESTQEFEALAEEDAYRLNLEKSWPTLAKIEGTETVSMVTFLRAILPKVAPKGKAIFSPEADEMRAFYWKTHLKKCAEECRTERLALDLPEPTTTPVERTSLNEREFIVIGTRLNTTFRAKHDAWRRQWNTTPKTRSTEAQPKRKRKTSNKKKGEVLTAAKKKKDERYL